MFESFDIDLEGFRETILKVIPAEKGDSIGHGPYLVFAKSKGYFVETNLTPSQQPRFVSLAKYKSYVDNRLWSGGGKDFKQPQGLKILGSAFRNILDQRSRLNILVRVSPCRIDSLLVRDLKYWLTYWFGGCTVTLIELPPKSEEKISLEHNASDIGKSKGVELSVFITPSDRLQANSIISSTCQYHSIEHAVPLKWIEIYSSSVSIEE